MLECLPNDYQTPERLLPVMSAARKANAENTCALILAGGQGRRMNFSDKGLLEWQGKTLTQHVIDAIQPQLNKIVISANQHHTQYQQFKYPVIADESDGFQGPLSGMAAAMKFCQQMEFLLVLPCDCPTPPADIFVRLSEALYQSPSKKIAIVDDGNRLQPLFGLYNTSLLTALTSALAQNHNKVMQFVKDHSVVTVDYSKNAGDFKNFNQPEDMQ